MVAREAAARKAAVRAAVARAEAVGAPCRVGWVAAKEAVVREAVREAVGGAPAAR